MGNAQQQSARPRLQGYEGKTSVKIHTVVPEPSLSIIDASKITSFDASAIIERLAKMWLMDTSFGREASPFEIYLVSENLIFFYDVPYATFD